MTTFEECPWCAVDRFAWCECDELGALEVDDDQEGDRSPVIRARVECPGAQTPTPTDSTEPSDA